MKSETIAPTDFVIPWGDGDDPGWRQAFAAARRAANGCDSGNRSKSGNESEGGNVNAAVQGELLLRIKKKSLPN